jgi:hypothetical protein
MILAMLLLMAKFLSNTKLMTLSDFFLNLTVDASYGEGLACIDMIVQLTALTTLYKDLSKYCIHYV